MRHLDFRFALQHQRMRHDACRGACRRESGFTLIELVVALTVIAIMLVLAVPSFTTTINTNRLAALSNDVIASMQTARMEAIRRGVRVVACRSDNGTSCSAGARWTGWIVFVDPDRNNAPNAAADILRRDTVKPPLQLWTSSRISGDGSRVVFRPDGLAHADNDDLVFAQLAACLPTNQPRENVRDISIAAGSRFNVSARNANRVCQAPPN